MCVCFILALLFKGPLKKNNNNKACSNPILLPAGGARAGGGGGVVPAAGGKRGHALWANSNLRATLGATSIGQPALTSQGTPGRVVLSERESTVELMEERTGRELRLPGGAARPGGGGTGEGEKQEKAARGGAALALPLARCLLRPQTAGGGAGEKSRRPPGKSISSSPPPHPRHAF